MNTHITEVTHANFDGEVRDADLPVLIDFWSFECGACLALNPLIEQVANQYLGRVKVVKVNAKEESEIAVHFRVRGLPTILLTKNGEVAARIEATRSRIFEALDDYLE